MKSKDYLEEKFTQLNKLKSMIITYPEEYKDSIIEVMNRVCDDIDEYIKENK